MRILEIGPGKSRIPNADTLDITNDCTYRAVWGVDKLPIANNSYDLIYTSHVLEHVPWFQTKAALEEAYRILKNGGCIEIWVPNFKYIIECYIHNQYGDDWIKYNNREYPICWVASRIFSYGPNFNWHKAIFDEDYLRFCLNNTGFTNIALLDKPRTDSHGPINLGITGTKL